MLTPLETVKTSSTKGAEHLLRQSSGVIPRLFTPQPIQTPDVPVLHLLVVDDDDPVREACVQIAERMGFAVRGAASVPEAEAVLNLEKMDMVLLDLKLPGGNALSLLEELKKLSPDTHVIVMTAYATVPSAVRAMQIGANHYLTKPFGLEELSNLLKEASQDHQVDLESRRLRERLRNESNVGPLIGRSPEMEKLYRILSKVSSSGHPVMIQGESGTGKETVARFIHFNGGNAKRPFIPVDCASPTPGVIENELFGFTKGAFAGAVRGKEGLLGLNDGGTIFLDEIGELSSEVQSKLMRTLQDRHFQPLGAVHPIPVTVRVLASSSRDLSSLVEQGKFRRDLYMRLNMVNLKIPALRERPSDIPLLAMHFLERFPSSEQKHKPHGFTDEALRLMTQFGWPGNVSELESAVNRVCTVDTGPFIGILDLPTYLINWYKDTIAQGRADTNGAANSQADANTRETNDFAAGLSSEGSIVSIADMEKQAILNSIRQLGGDKLKAAKLLGIGKTTLYRKLKEYGISEDV